MIFLSAKEQSLSVTDGIIVAESADFANEHDLLQSILYYGGWTRDKSYLKSATIALLRADLKAFFNITSVMLVIDDVDTLTTKGIDPGSDFIYRTLCRSTRYSKVVYTLRNAPSQSLLNAIEVPGLDDDDFEQFVKECSEHFQVPAPSEDFIKYKLSDVSERRPLVIESVIALRRTSGSYDKAIELFQQQCHVALNCKNAAVRALCCSLFENLSARYYQVCCNNDNLAGSGGTLSMVEASSLKRVRF